MQSVIGMHQIKPVRSIFWRTRGMMTKPICCWPIKLQFQPFKHKRSLQTNFQIRQNRSFCTVSYNTLVDSSLTIRITLYCGVSFFIENRSIPGEEKSVCYMTSNFTRTAVDYSLQNEFDYTSIQENVARKFGSSMKSILELYIFCARDI